MESLSSLKMGVEAGCRLAAPSDKDLEGVDDEIAKGFFESLEIAKKLGFKVFKVSCGFR
jgi:hypothetical protein